MTVKLSELKVLIVEDEASTRILLRATLRKFGISIVDEADDGEDGMRKLLREKHDLVLCDWLMPNVNGMDFLKEAKSHPEVAHVPILMVSGESEKESIVEAIKAGVAGYVVKPFNTANVEKQLLGAIEKYVIPNREAQKQNRYRPVS